MLLICGMNGVSSLPGAELWKSDRGSLRTSGEVMGRVESWDWYGVSGDAYGYGFQRTRIRLAGEQGNFRIRIEPQYVAMWGLPAEASPGKRGPSGMGALYYLHNGEEDPASIGFHQAVVELRGLPLGGRIEVGRMTYASGLEHLRQEDGIKFNTLKDMRLGDRLISSFEWSAFARAFDGVRVEGSLPGDMKVTASWLYPTQGGWEKDFNERIEALRIGALVVTAPKGRLLENTEAAAFLVSYRDERRCSQRVDNTMTGTVEADIDMVALGGHMLGIRKRGNLQWDYLLWGVYERGDWYELEQSAYAIALETGAQWMEAAMKPWLRIGYFRGSGDDDATDGTHGTFFQLIPGTRKYQLFPYYDLQNNESFYAHLILAPAKNLKLRLDYALNRMTEQADLWYMGTGATQECGNIFGYIGRPTGGNNSLSQEASLMIHYQHSASLSLNAFIAHAWGGDVIDTVYPEDADADLFTLEMAVQF